MLVWYEQASSSLPPAGVSHNVHSRVKGWISSKSLLAAYVAGARQPYQYTAVCTAISCQNDIGIQLKYHSKCLLTTIIQINDIYLIFLILTPNVSRNWKIKKNWTVSHFIFIFLVNSAKFLLLFLFFIYLLRLKFFSNYPVKHLIIKNWPYGSLISISQVLHVLPNIWDLGNNLSFFSLYNQPKTFMEHHSCPPLQWIIIWTKTE